MTVTSSRPVSHREGTGTGSPTPRERINEWGGRADDENERRCDEGDINRTENQRALFLVCVCVRQPPFLWVFQIILFSWQWQSANNSSNPHNRQLLMNPNNLTPLYEHINRSPSRCLSFHICHADFCCKSLFIAQGSLFMTVIGFKCDQLTSF